MYLGIDIGASKTLVARLTDEGSVSESVKFPTPKVYPEFLRAVAAAIGGFPSREFVAAGVAAPGRVNRSNGVVVAFGNLPWEEVPLKRDIERIAHCPAAVDNDANLAGLSEAILLDHDGTVLYVTVSTGIGTGVITNRAIDPNFEDSEGGAILLEHNGKLQQWEDFASGRAIVRRFGKKACEIEDAATWKAIAHALAVGLFDLITFIQPGAIIVGGSVGAQFGKFHDYLVNELRRYETPLTPIPPMYQAQRPEEAVVYGCYHLAKGKYGSAHEAAA